MHLRNFVKLQALTYVKGFISLTYDVVCSYEQTKTHSHSLMNVLEAENTSWILDFLLVFMYADCSCIFSCPKKMLGFVEMVPLLGNDKKKRVEGSHAEQKLCAVRAEA